MRKKRSNQAECRRLALDTSAPRQRRICALYSLDEKTSATRTVFRKLLHSPCELADGMLIHVFTRIGRIFDLERIQNDMHAIVIASIEGRLSLSAVELALAIDLDEKEITATDLDLALVAAASERRYKLIAVQFINWVSSDRPDLIAVLRSSKTLFRAGSEIRNVIDGTLERCSD